MNDFREAPIQRDALRNHRRLPGEQMALDLRGAQ